MRHARGRAHQQLLGHAHLVEAVGIGLREDVQVGVFAEVGRHADDLGPCLGQLDQRLAERAPAWSAALGAAIEAIIAEVVRRGAPSWPPSPCSPSRTVAYFERSCVPPASSACERLLPFVRLDAHEVVLLALLQERARPCPSCVSQMMTRGFGSAAARARRRRRATTASMSLPSTRCTCQPNAANFVGQRLEASTSRRGAVGLLIVDVDDADQVVELPVAGRHRAPPRSSPRPSSPSENRL